MMKTGIFVKLPVALLLSATLGFAHAGLFDDEEARRQVQEVSARMEAMGKAQFDMANQIESLREENARLRGQVETLQYELEASKKRAQDFYLDLDGRLTRLEGGTPHDAAAPSLSSDSGKKDSPKSEAPKSEASKAERDYEAALNLFKTSKLKESAKAFEQFVKTYPDHHLTPNAQYWLGNAYFANNECKRAIPAHRTVLSKWPDHARAPDALLNIAICQEELKDNKAAKASLESLLAKYPKSEAAGKARSRLKK